MSYTNIEQVKHHLVATSPAQTKIYNQAIIMGTDYVTFFEGPVDSLSVKVKSIRSSRPTPVSVTLVGGGVILSSAPLVNGTVTVASDSSLGTIYTENIDYIIDYDRAEMYLKEGGDLEPEQSLVAWFERYHVYNSGSDYQLDAGRGQIRKLSAGQIAEGESVYLDYTPIYESFNERIISAAVTETNGLIEREVDPEGRFGADPVLQAGATYRALEIICRAASARELSSLRGEDRTALAWIKLSEMYAERSRQLLRDFRPPFSGPSTPTHS